MTYPPRPGTISIPAVVAGNILQSDNSSVSINDNGTDGSIIMKTENNVAMIINADQKVSINTERFDSTLTINNDNPLTSTLQISYLDSFYFDGRITANGDMLFIPSCDDPFLNDNLRTVFKKNVDINDHNGSTTGLRLNGNLVTATATRLNYTDIIAGTSQPFRALVLDTNKTVTGINHIGSTTLAGTLTTGIQHGITEVDTLNIQTQLSLSGVPFTLSPNALSYLEIDTLGVAQASKALVLNSSRTITNINNISASTITGTLTAGGQPNITSLGTLNTLAIGGLSTFGDRITITAGTGNTLRLRYDNSNYSDINISPTGELLISSTGGLIKIETGNSLRISSHDGLSVGLILGSQLVRATASQLNYNIITPGTAEASKSLVLDPSKNIVGINLLGATSIAGTLTFGNQPNISSVNILNIVNHNANTTGLSLAGTVITASAAKINYIDTTPGSAQASKALVLDNTRAISNISSITSDNLYGTIRTNDQPNITSVSTLRIANHTGSEGLTLGAVLVTASGTQLNYINVVPGIAAESKAVVLDTSKNISGINVLSTTSINGTIITASQPNINSVNNLNIVAHNGSTLGLSLNGILVTATAIQLNRVNTTPGVADVGKAMILNNSKSISGINVISAANLTGILTTDAQPNIRLLQSIDIEDHNGSITGLKLGGVLVRSSADQLNFLTVTSGTALPSKALVLNGSGDVNGINTIGASNITGTIRTSNQPYILTVNTLNITSHDGGTAGLALGGTLITVDGNQINKLDTVDGTASASKALILNSVRSISNINTISATSFIGTITTAAQPNINSVNILNVAQHNGLSVGLSLGGTLITATASEINRVDTTAGVAIANKAMILNSELNFTGINRLSATTLSGTLDTQSQPNINLVNVLNIANHDGGSLGLRLGGTLIAATANQINYNVVIPGSATATRSMVTDAFNSISGVNSFTANRLVAEQLSLSGVISNFNTGGIIIKSYSMTNFIGRIVDVQLLQSLVFTNFQPANLTNSFSSEIIGYILPRYSETYTFFVNCNDRVRMWVNDVLVLHSWGPINGFRTSSSIFLNAEQYVKIYIQYQVDSVNSSLLAVEWNSLSNGRTNIPTGRLAWDSNQPSNDINHYTQNSLTIYNSSTIASNNAKFTVDTGGDLVIDASGNDITLGSQDNFNIPSHDGISSGLMLGGVLIQPTAFEINYLKVNPGVATASKAIVIDASKSITGINSISATSVSCTNLTTSAFTISNLTLSGPLNNYNTGSLLIRTFTGADVSGRIVNVNTISDINLVDYAVDIGSTYSLDIIGYILPGTTENYRFHAIANDRVRIWVNNILILNIWDTSTGLEYTSDQIQLTNGQWTPIYIQYQNITGSASLQVRWSSVSITKSFILSSAMAWDNSITRVPKPITTADSITLFSSQTGLLTVQTGTVGVDSNGNLNLSSKSGAVHISASNDLNIISHNGSRGLYLSGSLVQSTAAELNRVSGVVPGTVVAGKAIILDSSKAVTGLSSITADDLYGQLRTGSQPFITGIGNLSATLRTSSDILIGSTTLLRLLSDSSTSFIQCGASDVNDSSADLFIGNYNTNSTTSSRKFMIKATGSVGIQTNTPNRTFCVNGSGATYSMRLINNGATGAETNFTDFGTNSSGNLTIEPSGSTTNFLSDIVIGKVSPATLAVSSGVLKITSTSGSIQIGNTSDAAMPLEIGSASFTLSGLVGYLNSDGSTGTTSTNPSSFSLRTASSIIVNGSVCVTSDKRLKRDVQNLDTELCKKFIMESNPISFAYKDDQSKNTHYGLIAQEVAKSDFNKLVNFVPNNELGEIIDEDGFTSPEKIALNVSYMEIIPILMKTIKDLYQKNEELESKISKLYR